MNTNAGPGTWRAGQRGRGGVPVKMDPSGWRACPGKWSSLMRCTATTCTCRCSLTGCCGGWVPSVCRWCSCPPPCPRASSATSSAAGVQAPWAAIGVKPRLRPGPEVSGRQAIERFLDHAAVHYYHPAGSGKMGPASDPDSDVDPVGRVHGIEGLYVADASLPAAVISGNTNMPAAVIGERIARSLLGSAQPLADGRP